MELGIGSIAFIYDSINHGRFNNSIDLLLHSTERTFNFAEENEIKVCEIILDPPEILLSEKMPKFVDLCKSYHLIEKQFHAPYANLSLCTHNPWILDASIKCYVRVAEICKIIGAKVYTVHPGSAKFLHHSYNGVRNILIDSVNLLLDKIHNHELITCLENMPKMLGFFLRHKEIDKFFSEIRRNDIYFTWDTGHSSSCDENIEKLWEKLYPKIKNIHLVDNINGAADTHPALGEGNVDFEKIFEIVETFNYKGGMIMELHKVEDLTKSIEYLKNFY